MTGRPDHRLDTFPALITSPASASIACSCEDFQMSRCAAARRRVHFMSLPWSAGEPGGEPLASGEPGVLDVGLFDVDVDHRGVDSAVAEHLLDGDDVHTLRVQVRGSEVPKCVGCRTADPVRQMPFHGLCHRSPDRAGADLHRPATRITTFGGKERRPHLVQAIVEVPPRTLDPTIRAVRGSR